MIPEPEAGESILGDDHTQSDEDGEGHAHFVITAQTISAEDETADNRLQQIVRQTHTSEDA